MKDLITRDLMTVKEVAEALNVSAELVTKKIREIFPEKMQMGKTTYLNEKEVTAISLTIKENPHLVRSYEVKTELEKKLLIKQAWMFLEEEISELSAENLKLKTTVKRLVHDCDKTYTTTEIAKELQLKSAHELNLMLQEKNIQYKRNGTWVLTSAYSDKGYTETKQEEKNGIVIYNTHWTGKGRSFLLELFCEDENSNGDKHETTNHISYM